MKALVVDDDPVSLRLLEATFRKWGCDTLAARDGEEALALAKQQKPQLVIADVLMPRMNGYELCRSLKADSDLKDTPVILLTALSDPGDVLDALQCGADGFITKPYDQDFLANFIDQLTVRSVQPMEKSTDGEIEMAFAGRKYLLKPDVRQITHLLISTYENALQKNRELERANYALTRLKDSLRKANEELETKQANLDLDLEAAAGIQRSLLPRDGLDTPALHAAWKFQPCEMIGGDIFNMARLDDRHYAFYILDVSGHGLPAALVTVSVSQMLRADSGALVRPAKPDGHPREVVPPSEVLARLEREYPLDRFQKLFSIVYLIVDVQDGTARYSNAGHAPPLWLRADGTVLNLDGAGPIIGQGGALPFRDEQRSLQPGDRILLWTDGILEHRNRQGEPYGDLRLRQAVKRLATVPIEVMLDGVMEDVIAFGRQTPEDDMSLLAIEYRGKGGSLQTGSKA